MFRCCAGIGHLFCALALLVGLVAHGADIPIRDGGINPANLGKGDWIYFLSAATNNLGGSVPSVVNIPTLMSYYKSVGMQYIVIKVGTGSTNFTGGLPGTNQFTSNLVYQAHAAGLLIFPYTRSYADDVQGEINMAASCFAMGADGWIIDAEAEWESSRVGSTGPAKATQYGEGLRALFPNKFIAHAPFPVISFHSSLPYKEFGLFCDAVMPQAYWTEIKKDSPTAASDMFIQMDNEYRDWQNSLTGIYTNAIKPIVPIAQAWSSTSGRTTGAEIDEFFDRLRTNANPASVTGYKGISFWRADLKTADMWSAINTNILGDFPGQPNLTLQPQGRTVLIGTNVTFTAWGTGSKPFYYRWRFNGTNLPGATSAQLVLTNVQLAHSGSYSVVVSNVAGVTTSAVAVLNVTTPPMLVNVASIPGGRSAIITWRSTNAASSQVDYGLTPGYGFTTPEDIQMVTNHSILISGLAPNTNYFFGVVSRIGSTLYRSDGGSFSTAGELILDNTDADFTGTWTAGTSSPDKYGVDYRFAGTTEAGSTASAVYVPAIVTRGNYDIFIWYPQGANRSTNTAVSISYNGATTSTRVNQQTGGGTWRQVGTNLNFRPGTFGFVRISNGTGASNQVVMADAVRFVYRTGQDTPAGPAAPDWWAFHYFGANGNMLADRDGDGYADWMEYLAGTVPTDAASHLNFGIELSGNDVRVPFFPFVPGRRYELQQKTEPGSWLTLSNLPLSSSPDGMAWFRPTNTVAPFNAYRLGIRWE